MKSNPDAYFTAEQIQRLDELMTRWRSLRDAGQQLPWTEQAELEALVSSELEAATRRSAALAEGSITRGDFAPEPVD